MALIPAGSGNLPDGMRIEVIVTECQSAGGEPHFHLFPASHQLRKGKANYYDLITRVLLTEGPPEHIADVQAVKGNKPVPAEYQEAVFKWARENDKELGVNNWVLMRDFWDRMAASFH
jgi:hypothetical protein